MFATYKQLYDNALSDRDVWMADESRYSTVGHILTDKDLIVENDLLDSKFYNAWMRPQDLFHRQQVRDGPG